MAVLNFSDIAKTKIADVEKPPLAPQGEYRWGVSKIPEVTTLSNDKGNWDIVTFNVRALEAVTADLSDYKGEVTGILQSIKFFFDKNDEVNFDRTKWNLRTFLEKHLKVADDSMSMAEALNASVNAQFLAPIVWNPDKNNPGEFFANIGRTAPLE